MIGLQIQDHAVKHTAIVYWKAHHPGRHDAKPSSKYYGRKKDQPACVVGA